VWVWRRWFGSLGGGCRSEEGEGQRVYARVRKRKGERKNKGVEYGVH